MLKNSTHLSLWIEIEMHSERIFPAEYPFPGKHSKTERERKKNVKTNSTNAAQELEMRAFVRFVSGSFASFASLLASSQIFAFWHEEENIGENSDGDDAAADDDGIPANCWTEGGLECPQLLDTVRTWADL